MYKDLSHQCWVHALLVESSLKDHHEQSLQSLPHHFRLRGAWLISPFKDDVLLCFVAVFGEH